ncbi:barstar family protein [Nonomuraea montanisoli]
MDHQCKRIGAYYIRRANFGTSNEIGRSDDLVNVVSSFHGYAYPHPYAGDIWRRWALGGIKLGEWASRPTDTHDSWLHVAQTVWFESGRRAIRYGADSTVSMDGSTINSEPSFYCATGEAVNGAGGYFGSSLSGLADCLSSVRKASLQVIWNEARHSRERLGEEFFTSAVNLMQEFGIEVTLR